MLEVDLDRAELPGTAEGVLDAEIDLRPVERAVPRRHDVRPPRILERGGERGLPPVPERVRADPLLRAQPERHLDLRESEGPVHGVHEVEEPEDLVLHLLERREDVGVVLRERPDAGQPGRDSRELVAVQPAEVGVAHRKVPVRPEPRLVQEEVARAVHRLDAELPLVDQSPVHVVVVVLVVPGQPEEIRVEDLRGDDLLVAAAGILRAEILEERVVEDRPFRMEEGRRRRPRVEGEEVELLAEPAVVAGLRVFQPLQVLLELLLRQERGPVDALEHRVLLVPLPVRPGGVGQLEDPELSRGGDVRAAAEIDEFSLPVAGDALADRDAARDLDLQVVLLLLEDRDRFFDRHVHPLDRQVFADDLAHLGLDRGQIFRREGARRVEVVVVAVLDRRTDPDLDVGKEALDRLGRQVRRRVPVDGHGVRRLRGDDLERRVLFDRRFQVHDLAAELPGPGVLGQARPDLEGDVADGRPPGDGSLGSVRKSDRDRVRPGFHSTLLKKQKTRVAPRRACSGRR